MSKGAPDYTEITEIKGFDGSELRTLKVDNNGELYSIFRGMYGTALKNIAVDANGQLYAILRGANGNDVTVDGNGYLSVLLKGNLPGIDGNVTVDQNEKDREMKGVDPGSTLKTLAVDSNGQLIAILKGASGNEVAVDVNGYLTAILKGYDGSSYKTIKTDSDGRIEALMKGLYNSTPTALKVDSAGRIIAMLNALYNTTETPLKCDANGNLKLNLTAQDLALLKQKPSYGGSILASYDGTVNSSTETTLFSDTGEGMVYGGYVYVLGGGYQNSGIVRLYIDGVKLTDTTFATLRDLGKINIGLNPLWLSRYDNVNDRYCVCFGFGMTFDTSIAVKYREQSGKTPTIHMKFVYTKVS